MNFNIDLNAVAQWLLTNGTRVVAIIIGAFVAIWIVRIFVHKSKRKIGDPDRVGIERAKRTETLARIVETTFRVVILLGALLMVLKQVGIEIGPLLAGAGIVGLAVGFGAQSLVKDIIGGFFILLENLMNVGDIVKIAGSAGVVESINLRVTVLRDLDGNVHIVPNGEIGVAYKEDVDEVIRILEDVADTMRKDGDFATFILDPLEVLGLDSFGDSSINIKVRLRTLPAKQWVVAREFRKRIKKAFDEKGIEIPFPHRTLYIGEASSAARLKLDVKKTDG
jgi:small-conductance mechanosensitive channel